MRNRPPSTGHENVTRSDGAGPADPYDDLVIRFDDELHLVDVTPRAAELLPLADRADGTPCFPQLAASLGYKTTENPSDSARLMEAAVVAIGGESWIRVGRRLARGFELRLFRPADHAATLQRLHDRNHQQAFVAELGQRALEGASRDELTHAACDGVSRALGVEFSKVLLLSDDGSELELAAGVGWRAGRVGRTRVPADLRSLAAYTLQRKDPVVVTDFAAETRFTPPALLTEHGVVSGLSVILGTPAAPWGVLGAHTDHARHFSADEVNFLQSVAGILGSAQQRRGTEASLARSESRMRLMIDAMPALISFVDRDLTYRFCNTAYSEWFGRPAAEIIGHHVESILGTPAFHRIRDRMERANAGEAIAFETRAPHHDGREREVHVRYVPHVPNGAVEGFFALVEDISERKRHEAELLRLNGELESRVRRRTAELETIADNVPAFFAFIDTSLRYRFVNRAYGETCGIETDEMIGRPVHEMIGPDNFELIAPRLRAALAGERQAFTATLRIPEHGPVSIRSTLVPRRAEDGAVTGIFALTIDISAERELERAVLEASDRERERLGRELHDSLCQELGGISMLAKALEHELPAEESLTRSLAGELSSRVSGALAQSRRIAHGLSLVPRGDLRECLRRLVDSSAQRAPDCRIEFIDRTRDLPLPESSGSQLFLICQEAVGNALRHGRPSRVEITLEEHPGGLDLRVRDDGDGLADHLDPDAGLGLRSMRYRAHVIGGDLLVRPRPHSPGIEVLCSVPSHPQPDSEPHPDAASRPGSHPLVS